MRRRGEEAEEEEPSPPRAWDVSEPDGELGWELGGSGGRTGGNGSDEGSASNGQQTRSALWAAKLSRCMSSAHAEALPEPWALATKWSESSSDGSSESVRQPPLPGADGSLAPER